MNTLTKISVFLILICLSSNLSAQPNVQWSKCYGGPGGDRGADLIQAFSTGYILVGTEDSCTHGGGDFSIKKLDDTGKVIWSYCYGGSGGDHPVQVVKVTGENAADYGYIIAGETGSNDGDVTGNHGSLDYWVIKVDTNGLLQWQKTLGGSGSEEAKSATQTTDGAVVIAGHSMSNDGDVVGNHGGYDYWLVKIAPSGNIIWKKTFGGSVLEFMGSIAATYDGGVIATGLTESGNGDVTNHIGLRDVWTVKIDASGNKQWQKIYGSFSDDWGMYVTQVADSGYLVSARTTNFPNTGDYLAILKYSNTGNLQWTTIGKSIASVVRVGSGYVGLATNTNADGVVAQMDTSCSNITWQKSLGGTGIDGFGRLLIANDGGYIMAGLTNSNDGDVSDNNGDYDMWVVKMAPDPLSISAVGHSHSAVGIYPNPARDRISFSQKANVKLIDMLGQTLLDQQSVNSINISSFDAGIYFLVFYDSERRIVQKEKIIKE